MTRINVIPVKELCNQHLFAEWREMPRIVDSLTKSLSRKKLFNEKEIPERYVLGKGHVKFFYDKFKFLHKRHMLITKELLKRGYVLSKKDSNIFKKVEQIRYKDWYPSEEEIKINRERVLSRIPKNAKWGKVNGKTDNKTT